MTIFIFLENPSAGPCLFGVIQALGEQILKAYGWNSLLGIVSFVYWECWRDWLSYLLTSDQNGTQAEQEKHNFPLDGYSPYKFGLFGLPID